MQIRSTKTATNWRTDGNCRDRRKWSRQVKRYSNRNKTINWPDKLQYYDNQNWRYRERNHRRQRITGHQKTIGQKIIWGEKILPVTRKYPDGNKNEVAFTRKITVEAESNRIKKNLSLLITERENIKPLLGMEWQREFNRTIRHIEKSTTPTDQSERDEKFTEFEKMFETNQTIKNAEIKKPLAPGHTSKKQKAKPILYHLQKYDCFVSPVLITVKKYKSVKIALDSRKLNDSCTKMRPRMTNKEKLLNQISSEITQAPNEPLCISKTDLEYAYGQLKLSKGTSKHCNFAITGGNNNGEHRFKRVFYGLSDTPTIFLAKIDKTLEYVTSVWLDDLIVVTSRDKDKQWEKLFKIPERLQGAGYKESEKKTNFFSEKPFGRDTR